MIELNEKTRQDFLDREWAQKLLDAGIDMSDAKYIIAKDRLSKYDDEPDLSDYIWYKDFTAEVYDVCPTYSTAELLYKLPEWIYDKIDDKSYSGGLRIFKDAPFYYSLYTLRETGKENRDGLQYHGDLFSSSAEYPIEALALLLIQVKEKLNIDINIKSK